MFRHLWTPLCPEFGEDDGKTAMIVIVLYGLKSTTAFRSHHARCMESFGYMSCKANPDLWLKLEIRLEDGVQCYCCLFCYMDDILCIHHNADAVLEWLHKSFPLRPGFGNPDMYRGVKLHKTRLHKRV